MILFKGVRTVAKRESPDDLGFFTVAEHKGTGWASQCREDLHLQETSCKVVSWYWEHQRAWHAFRRNLQEDICAVREWRHTSLQQCFWVRVASALAAREETWGLLPVYSPFCVVQLLNIGAWPYVTGETNKTVSLGPIEIILKFLFWVNRSVWTDFIGALEFQVLDENGENEILT